MLPEISELGKRRRRLGVTQTQLAKLAGVSQSLIAKIERGRVDPSFSNVKRLSDALEVLERRESVSAKDIMTGSIISVRKSELVSGAIKLIQSNGISQLPVMDGEHLIGSFSEGTITELLASGTDSSKLSKMTVVQVMDEPFPTVREDTPISAISPLLQHNSAVVVVRGGKGRGIITKADLLKAVRK
ncbi:MAG: CBS domain-containing protein [Candidatus Burarchaeum sp.]|nr:CBS domain-containing protein [Candidatus Burarchaeum sp.]MDO8340265.1 CBS domain-containing protein [Candidatus Burarchaeum sp.]